MTALSDAVTVLSDAVTVLCDRALRVHAVRVQGERFLALIRVKSWAQLARSVRDARAERLVECAYAGLAGQKGRAWHTKW